MSKNRNKKKTKNKTKNKSWNLKYLFSGLGTAILLFILTWICNFPDKKTNDHSIEVSKNQSDTLYVKIHKNNIDSLNNQIIIGSDKYYWLLESSNLINEDSFLVSNLKANYKIDFKYTGNIIESNRLSGFYSYSGGRLTLLVNNEVVKEYVKLKLKPIGNSSGAPIEQVEESIDKQLNQIIKTNTDKIIKDIKECLNT